MMICLSYIAFNVLVSSNFVLFPLTKHSDEDLVDSQFSRSNNIIMSPTMGSVAKRLWLLTCNHLAPQCEGLSPDWNKNLLGGLSAGWFSPYVHMYYNICMCRVFSTSKTGSRHESESVCATESLILKYKEIIIIYIVCSYDIPWQHSS